MTARNSIVSVIAPDTVPQSRETAGSVPAGSQKASVEYHNLAPSELIEHAIHRGEGRLAHLGALAVETGIHTGRSPDDKFVVRHGELAEKIWWGSVNQPMTPESFAL